MHKLKIHIFCAFLQKVLVQIYVKQNVDDDQKMDQVESLPH